MNSTKALILALIPAALIFTGTAIAQVSKYAGQEKREIKSLSPDDIAELKSGGGWGLARAAELNGMPGPAHLLELKDKIRLESEQINAIETIHAKMKTAAIAQGEKLIELERQLEEKFRSREISDEYLRRQLEKISQTRRELRYIHLSTHLSTPEMLSAQQIERYNQLRGYASDNPCDNVPEGHDAAMWKNTTGVNRFTPIAPAQSLLQ